jgi:hypothetical protein
MPLAFSLGMLVAAMALWPHPRRRRGK